VEIEHIPGLTASVVQQVLDGTLHIGFGFLPQDDAELLAVPDIGMSIVQKYGVHIYRLIAGSN